MANWKGFGRK